MNLTHNAKILTILDKPKHEQLAWRRTLELKGLTNARVDAVSFCWNAMCENQAVLDAPARKKLRHTLVEERKEWLGGVVGDEGKVRQRVVWEHDIGDWVTDEVAERPVDLIVKTVNKTKSLMHTPTDWTLLETCQAPLLFTSGKKRRSGKIAAAIDLRHNDTKHRHLNCKVLDAAHVFAKLHEAEVHVVFAVEISQVLRDLDVLNETVSKKKIVERVTPELNRLLKPYDIPKSRIHLPVGKVGKVVAQTARKLKADLLVLGSYSHRVKQKVGVGNSAERILTKAVTDVLAVHP